MPFKYCNVSLKETIVRFFLLTGLGSMHLVVLRVERYYRLPPTGAGATSCVQGFVNNLGDDECSISVARESRHGDPTISKLFGKTIRIDRI